MKKSTVLALGALLGLSSFSTHRLDAAVARTYVSGNFVLTLDGAAVGFIKSVEGGGVVADAVAEPVPPKAVFPKKHLGSPRIEPLELTLSGGTTRTVWDWMGAALNGAAPPKNGVVSALDANFNEVSRVEFDRATISEIDFPELNAASTDAFLVDLVLQPGAVRRKTGAGTRPPAASAPAAKTVRVSNFRVSIDGLPEVGPRVSKVSPITVKLSPASISNLTIVVQEAFARQLFDWHEQAVVKGQGESAEKTGTIEMLSPDMRTMIKLSFRGLGIMKLTLVDDSATRKVAAEMYVEDIKAEFPGM